MAIARYLLVFLSSVVTNVNRLGLKTYLYLNVDSIFDHCYKFLCVGTFISYIIMVILKIVEHKEFLYYTKILEVNLFVFAYRLFHRDSSPINGTELLYY